MHSQKRYVYTKNASCMNPENVTSSFSKRHVYNHSRYVYTKKTSRINPENVTNELSKRHVHNQKRFVYTMKILCIHPENVTYKFSIISSISRNVRSTPRGLKSKHRKHLSRVMTTSRHVMCTSRKHRVYIEKSQVISSKITSYLH